MGAEGSIELFEENQLEDELGLLKDESLKDIFNRSLANMVDVMIHPIRMNYDFNWLKARYNGCDDYKVNEFQYSCSDGTKLHCVKWIRDPDAKLCIVYLHTNSRCLSDATELLPLCNLLNANLLAFDQRGAGRSDGQLSFRIVEDLTSILQSLCGGNLDVKVILWARGMASYVGVQYVTQQQEAMAKWESTAPARRMMKREKALRKQQAREQLMKQLGSDHPDFDDEDDEDDEDDDDDEPSQYVKFIVLDSPFTSLKSVVMETAKNIDMLGASIPPMFVKFALYMFKDKISERLDVDPYTIDPLSWLENSTKRPISLPPCYILSADSDEHIPVSMGAQMAQQWRKNRGRGGNMCWFREFPGGHFDEREECLVMTPIQAILDYVSIHELGSEGNGVKLELVVDDEDVNVEDEGEESVWTTSIPCGAGADDCLGKIIKPNIDIESDIGCGNQKKNPQKSGSRKKVGLVMQDTDRPQWQDSTHMKHCSFCSAEFSMIFRKHHCRRCGQVVCASCSSSRVPLPARCRVSPVSNRKKRRQKGDGDDEEIEVRDQNEDIAVVRVCDACANLLHLSFK